MTQLTGDLGFNMTHQHLQRVRAGRLADCADGRRCSTACATTSTSIRRASPTRRSTQTHEFNIDTQQLRPARRRGVVDRPDDGAARQHRASCTTSRFSAATSRRCSCPARRARRSTPSTRTTGGRARRSRPASATGTLAQQSPWAVDPDFQVAHTWQANAQVERAFGSDLTASVERDVREGHPAAGRDRRQPDQPDRHARRRPADLQHRGERGDARSIRASTTSTRCSRSASRRSSR